MNGMEKEYLEAGMDDYIAKPIQRGVLIGKLAELQRAQVAKNV
jgi:CheY-like chemotaxis protein